MIIGEVTVDIMFLDIGNVGCGNENVVVNLCSDLPAVGIGQGVEKLERCWLRCET